MRGDAGGRQREDDGDAMLAVPSSTLAAGGLVTSEYVLNV